MSLRADLLGQGGRLVCEQNAGLEGALFTAEEGALGKPHTHAEGALQWQCVLYLLFEIECAVLAHCWVL
jgi:hypothetical protein